MSKPQEDKQRISLSIWAENKGELDRAITNAGKLVRKIRTFDDDLTKSREEIIAVQRELEDCLNVYDPLSVFETSPYKESVWRKIIPLKEMIETINSAIGGYLKQQTKKVNTKVSRLILESVSRTSTDADVTIDNLNSTAHGYYLLIEAITLPNFKAALTSLPSIHQPNQFILSYGHAVHSLGSFHDDKIIQKYLHSSSPIEVRAVKDDLERRLDGIIRVERPVVEDFLSEVPTGDADISRRQKKKFLDESLTPKINALYREMQLVCSSGMKYFDLRRELRADVMYLERSAALLQRIGDKIKDNVKQESTTTEEVKELLDISTHKSYLLVHKELEGMVFVGREAKRYNELYSQVVGEAKELLIKLDNEARIYKDVVEKKAGKPVVVNDEIDNNTSKPQRAQEAIPSAKEATISQTAAQRPKLEVVSGYAVVKVKTQQNSEKAGTQTEVSTGASTRVSRREERPVRSVEYVECVESVEHVKPAQTSQVTSSSYSTNTTSAYDITAKLQDINEPEDPALKSFYNLLYGRDQIGRFIIASPTEIAQMFRLIKLQRNDGVEKGREEKRIYSETDKTFLREAIGYLNNPETLMYGAIKGSDVIKSAPRLMHDAMMIIR